MGSCRKIVCVHGADDEVEVDAREVEMSLLTTGVVVTRTVSQNVAQPVWQVEQRPCVVVVVVVGQHSSLAGT
jgi:hypothetical protein